MSNTISKRQEAMDLLKELLNEPLPSESRMDDILESLDKLIPDPEYTKYIYHSDELINEDGNFDYEGLIKKCFDDYEPNVIAL